MSARVDARDDVEDGDEDDCDDDTGHIEEAAPEDGHNGLAPEHIEGKCCELTDIRIR